MEYSAPQVAGRDEPFRSAIREHLQGHTQRLEDLAIEMLARGLSVRDIEDAFKLLKAWSVRRNNEFT
jgi:putative transposase